MNVRVTKIFEHKINPEKKCTSCRQPSLDFSSTECDYYLLPMFIINKVLNGKFSSHPESKGRINDHFRNLF